MSKFDKFSYEVLRYGIFLAAFVPLIFFRNSFSPFNFGKAIAFRTLVEVLLIFYLYLIFKYPRLWPFRFRVNLSRASDGDRIFWLLSVFTIVAGISSTLGINWHQSFWGYWERMGGLFAWLHLYAFFILAMSIIKTREDLNALLCFSVGAAVMSSVFGFLQKLPIPQILGADERVRIFGTLGNPAAFAGYLLFNFYFACHLLRQNKSRTGKHFLAFSIGIILTALALTEVRGAILGLTVGLLSYLILVRKQVLQIAISYKKILIAILIFVVAGGALFAWKTDIRSLSLVQRNILINTFKQRLTVWATAWEGVKSRPLLGWGPENFSQVFSKYYDPQVLANKDELIFDRAHNFILDVATTHGILGLIVWLGLWGYLFYIFLKRRDYLFVSFIFAYLTHLLFFFDLLSTYLMLMFLLVYVLSEPERSPNFSKVFYFKVKFAALIVFSLGLITLVYWANVQPALANFYSTRGYGMLLQQQDRGGLDYFEYNFKHANWSEPDAYRKATESYLSYIFTTKKRSEADAQFLSRLTTYYQKLVQQKGGDYSDYIYLYKIRRTEQLFFGGNPDKSEEVLKSAMEKFPRVVPLYYELFNHLLEGGQMREAEKVIEAAYKLDQDLLQTKFRLGLVYILNGLEEKQSSKKQDGHKLLQECFDSNYIPDDINYLFKVLEQKGAYDDLINTLGRLVSKKPELHVPLAYFYLKAGDRPQALVHADMALTLAPKQLGHNGFLTLSEIYRILGNNKKRSEAFLKSAQ